MHVTYKTHISPYASSVQNSYILTYMQRWTWVGLTHGLGWVELGPATKIGVFYSHVICVFITINYTYLLKFQTNAATHVTLSCRV